MSQPGEYIYCNHLPLPSVCLFQVTTPPWVALTTPVLSPPMVLPPDLLYLHLLLPPPLVVLDLPLHL